MMKKLFLFAFLFPSFSLTQAQFYTETFDGTTCAAGSGCDQSLVGWTLTNGTNGATANKFYVSDTESGMPAGQCGAAGMNDQSLHIGNVAGSTFSLICPAGDCGAAYDASSAAELTDKRAESPTINCTGQSTITIAFNYIENGQGTNDDATLWYFDGATWAQINALAKTTVCGSGQGMWTAFSMAMPASANNNPNVKIGFRWVNDGDGVGSDPSFAVDDITLTSSVSTPPVASFTASSTSICEGDCINFTNTSTGGPFTTTSWTFTGASTGTSSTNNPTNICYPTAGTYTVTLTVTDANGTDTETQTNYITVTTCSTPPVASFTASSTSICEGDCINFTNTSTGGPFTTTSWTFAGASTATSAADSPTNICYPTAGTYTVTLTVTDANGTDTETQTNFITVTTCTAAPVASFTASSTSICEGDCINFTNTSTGSPFTTTSWTFAGSSTATSSANNPTNICYPTAGTYTVTLTVTNASGTDTETQTNFITVSNCSTPPVTSFTASDSTICDGDCITFSNTTTGASSYSWSFSGGTPSTAVSQNPGTICYNTPGTYTVSLTASNASGSTTTSHTIVVGATPGVTASVDTTIDLGTTVSISATGSGSGTYSWSPTAGLSCTNCANPDASPMGTTAYIVTYTENGCSATDTVIVNVTIIEAIGLPNAFSPNGDGHNDVLSVLGQGIVSMRLIIYNRYGQQVFESISQSNGWDGTHDGKDVNTGAFAYYLEYTLISGATGTKKGNVTLIR